MMAVIERFSSRSLSIYRTDYSSWIWDVPIVLCSSKLTLFMDRYEPGDLWTLSESE